MNFKKILMSGIQTPPQRIGFLILILGIASIVGWFLKRQMDFGDVFDPYYFPDKRDFIFFHLYLYLIPLGILLTWGFPLIKIIKEWVIGDNKNIIVFSKRQELTNFIRKTWDLEKGNLKPALGYVSSVLTPDESYKEALQLGIINQGDKHVLHVDVLLITEHGEELVFAPCDCLVANLNVGDFVMLATFGNGLRQDWHYTLIAKLEPAYNKKGKGWIISQDYRIK